MRVIIAWAATAALMAGGSTAAAGTATAQTARTARVPAERTTTLCRQNAKEIVSNSSGSRFIIRNDWWGAGDDQCISNRNRWSNFTVTRSHPAGHARVAGFPYILVGCAWGACTPRSPLPVRVTPAGSSAAT